MNKHQEVELLDHMAVLFLIFWWISILFSIVTAPIYILTNSAQGLPFLHNPHQYFLFVVFLIIAILTGMSCYLTVVLICISLMINMLSIFSCTCWPSVCLLDKCLSTSSAHFLYSFCLFVCFPTKLYKFFIYFGY